MWSLWENREALRAFVEAQGALAPLAFVALQALQVVLAPLPGEVTGFLAGYLFGPWEGFFLAMSGLALGSSAAFGLARLFERSLEAHFRERPFYQRTVRFTRRHGPTAAFLLFLFPGLPKDYLCYALGLLPFPFRLFFPVMLLGRAPATLALTFQGDALYRADWRRLFWVGLAVGLALCGFLILKRRLEGE
ncbi:TVP38/TMEM64 family protein [Thermosulfurimonas marina]|uniref:TVP38/TMEM64 family protein n=1 Tax=Thermosulfurimonas marina TaxID=2047767 RepID=UPI00144A586B|nr:VTT domain-containing protein [Thermosulfurimonas marina]